MISSSTQWMVESRCRSVGLALSQARTNSNSAFARAKLANSLILCDHRPSPGRQLFMAGSTWPKGVGNEAVCRTHRDLRAVLDRHRPDVGMQIDHGCRHPTGLLRQDDCGGLIPGVKAIAASSASTSPESNCPESSCPEKCGFDQRGGCGDERAAEEYLPRLLRFA